MPNVAASTVSTIALKPAAFARSTNFSVSDLHLEELL
jgi:hypothetical protein